VPLVASHAASSIQATTKARAFSAHQRVAAADVVPVVALDAAAETTPTVATVNGGPLLETLLLLPRWQSEL